MLNPDDFIANHAWIAFKANDAPIHLREGLFDLSVLMDVYSTLIFGSMMMPAGSESPSNDDARALLVTARAQSDGWPKTLIIPNGHSAMNNYKVLAEQFGINVMNYPDAELVDLLGDTKAMLQKVSPSGSRS